MYQLYVDLYVVVVVVVVVSPNQNMHRIFYMKSLFFKLYKTFFVHRAHTQMLCLPLL